MSTSSTWKGLQQTESPGLAQVLPCLSPAGTSDQKVGNPGNRHRARGDLMTNSTT